MVVPRTTDCTTKMGTGDGDEETKTYTGSRMDQVETLAS